MYCLVYKEQGELIQQNSHEVPLHFIVLILFQF